MSTSDKEPITGYSADYRSVHPPKQKAERPAPKQTVGKPKQPAGKTKPRAAEQKTEKPRAEKAKAEKPKTAGAKTEKPEPKPAASPLPPERLENDEEIDDFLPAGEKNSGEELLTKWSGEEQLEAAPKKKAHRRTGKYRYGLLAGSLVLLLALVGVAFIAVTAGTRIHAALTDDSALRSYDKMLAVAVAQDPQPFASPDKADPEFVLNASIWKTMTENSSSYTSYDDAGRTIVPLGDVADACGELFGPACSLQPKNPTAETFYTYDAAKAQFHISLYSLESTYEPYTVSAKKEDDSVILRVGYIPPTDPTRASSVSSGTGSASARPTPAKYMEYVLKTNASTKKEYIYAVRKAT